MTRLTLETYGDLCWLCGHGGATSADHVLPRSRGGSDAIENLRPAHHDPCPTCARRCNAQRGNKLRVTRPRRSTSSAAWFGIPDDDESETP